MERTLMKRLGKAVVLWVLGVVVSQAASAPGAIKSELLQIDFPFQGACVSAEFPTGNVAMKGLAIRVGTNASVLFDTDLCRMAAGWVGGYITTHGVAFDGDHGGHPAIHGEQKFGTAKAPGVAGANRSFRDTRKEAFGPMDGAVARWDGLQVHGMDVLLSYSIEGGTKVSEHPTSINSDGQTVFVRSFQLDAPLSGFWIWKSKKVASPFAIAIADVDGPISVSGEEAKSMGGRGLTLVRGMNLPKGVRLNGVDGKIVLEVGQGVVVGAGFSVAIWQGREGDVSKVSGMTSKMPQKTDFSKAGSARWPQTIVTKGILAKAGKEAYVVDTLTPPTENPWKRRVRFGGFDFFKDGSRAAVCTWDGDIWIVSGIDENLEKLEWRRFASGMYETLGLRIVDDVIYTSGRDQITRYRDLNGDGEADLYENFNNQVTSSEGFHEFVFDLQTDRAGNFYFGKAAPVKGGGRGFETISANAGTITQVSKDGKTSKVYATGFRAPNGIGVNPWNDQVTSGDNEGTWVPTCPVNWVKEGGFYGVEDTAHGVDVKSFREPLVWMSHDEFDNSGGGQVWVDSDQWGPFKGRLLHLSYGQCAVYLVMPQEVAGQMQGGVVKIPVKFASSAMRGRFNPKDGQLYVAGLQGWQTKAVKISGFDRVRYTGQKVYSVEQLKVDSAGMHLTFSQPLDAKDAADVQNYDVKRWNYARTSDYGSPTFSVKDPKKKGRDNVEVTGAILSSDGKTVTLKINDLREVDQMQVKYSIRAADGSKIDQVFQNSVHAIPSAVGSVN